MAPNPPDIFKDQNVINAQNGLNGANNQAKSALDQYNTMNTGAPSFANALKQALLQKWNYNQDLVSAKNNYLNAYLNAGNDAANQVAPQAQSLAGQGGVVNPYAVNDYKQRAINNAYTNYSGASDLLNQRMGSLKDIIDTGNGVYQTGVNAAKASSEAATQAQQLAMQQYTNAYNTANQNYQNWLAKQQANAVTQQADAAKQQAAASMVMAQNYGRGYGASNYQQTTPLDTWNQNFTGYLSKVDPNNTIGVYNQQNNLYRFLQQYSNAMPSDVRDYYWKMWNSMPGIVNSKWVGTENKPTQQVAGARTMAAPFLLNNYMRGSFGGPAIGK